MATYLTLFIAAFALAFLSAAGACAMFVARSYEAGGYRRESLELVRAV